MVIVDAMMGVFRLNAINRDFVQKKSRTKAAPLFYVSTVRL